ncbi:MAG: diacylglycerol kinase family lipid kinase [Lachnospiraceae bacterium]|nr:diacylglycerol kinase family lipid kinase [Lachnospiraceae bacterium]
MYYFIVNPASGSGKGILVWEKIKTELEQLGVSYRSFLLSGTEEAKKLAQGLSSLKYPVTVIAVGGDGTINEIINGLTSFEHITLGCIPTGSGNDFVRGLGLARDPLEALQAILHPKKVTEINVGLTLCPGAASKKAEIPGANAASEKAGAPGSNAASEKAGTPGFSYAVSSGIGFDAAVCNSVLHSRLKNLLNRFHSGKLIYLFTALWQLFTMKRQTMQITIDGKESHIYERAYFAAAMNLRYEGGGFMFCPEALPGDDHLDLLVANGISRLQALLLLPRALFGKHVGHTGVHIIRCQKADIRIPEKTCLHTDGEIPGFYRHVTFTLREEKLPVILR